MAEPLPLPTPAQLVTITALAIPLMRLCLMIVAMGIVACADALCRALFGTLEGAVGWIPYLGRVVQTPLHRIEQKVSNYLGGLEAHVDVSMGGYIHALADAVGRLASGEAEAGWALWLVAKAVHATRVTLHALPSIGTVTHTVTRTVVRETRPVIIRMGGLTKIVSHIPAALLATIAVLEGNLGRVIEWDIPRLWKWAHGIERRLDRLWHRIRALEKPLVGAAFAAAVAVALGRLGLGWLRCSSASAIGKKRGCSLWRDLDKLLGTLTEVALVANICEVLPWIERGFSVVASPLIGTLTSIGAGLCDPRSSPPELLPDPTLYLPASRDASLHLAA